MAETERDITEYEHEGTKYQLTFTPKSHGYYLRTWDQTKREWSKAARPPSVTAICGMLDKPGLVFWSARLTANYIMKHMVTEEGKLKPGSKEAVDDVFVKAKAQHQAELIEAGRIGTICHEGVEEFLKSGKKLRPAKGRPPEAIKAFRNFVRWWEKDVRGSTVHSTERRLFHPKYGYVGTTDIVADIRPPGTPKHKRFLIDIKTSNDFHAPAMPMQLAAYAEAYEVLEGVPIEGIGIIRLDKLTGQSYWWDYTEQRKGAFKLFATLLEAKKIMGANKWRL